MPGHEVEADDYDGLGANPSEADGEAELEAFFELLTESFYDVDETLSGSISFEDLEKIMKSLMEEELLQNYQPEDLEMLAHDMDVNENGQIPYDEFIDVLFRLEQGHIVHRNPNSDPPRTYESIGQAPVAFTDKELEEAFKVFSLGKSEFGSKEIRGVMQAVAGKTVRALDAKKMVEAAATTPDKPNITFEEFKKIIFWTPESEA